MSAITENVQNQIRQFVIEEFLDGDDTDFENDLELVKTSIIDSINVLRMVEFIEDEYDIELEPTDVQKFTTVINITAVIREKLDS